MKTNQAAAKRFKITKKVVELSTIKANRRHILTKSVVISVGYDGDFLAAGDAGFGQANASKRVNPATQCKPWWTRAETLDWTIEGVVT